MNVTKKRYEKLTKITRKPMKKNYKKKNVINGFKI